MVFKAQKISDGSQVALKLIKVNLGLSLTNLIKIDLRHE